MRQRLDNGNIHRLIVTQLLVMNGYLRLQSYDGFGWRRKEFNYRVNAMRLSRGEESEPRRRAFSTSVLSRGLDG